MAIVWIAATLGSKHSYKKLTKKEVNSVNVEKACEFIVSPPEPLALRLTSNLLIADINHVVSNFKRKLLNLQKKDLNITTTTAREDAITIPEPAATLLTVEEIFKVPQALKPKTPNHSSFLTLDRTLLSSSQNEFGSFSHEFASIGSFSVDMCSALSARSQHLLETPISRNSLAIPSQREDHEVLELGEGFNLFDDLNSSEFVPDVDIFENIDLNVPKSNIFEDESFNVQLENPFMLPNRRLEPKAIVDDPNPEKPGIKRKRLIAVMDDAVTLTREQMEEMRKSTELELQNNPIKIRRKELSIIPSCFHLDLNVVPMPKYFNPKWASAWNDLTATCKLPQQNDPEMLPKSRMSPEPEVARANSDRRSDLPWHQNFPSSAVSKQSASYSNASPINLNIPNFEFSSDGYRYSDVDQLKLDEPQLELLDKEFKAKDRDSTAFYLYLKEIMTTTATSTLYLSDILLEHSDKVAASDAFYNNDMNFKKQLHDERSSSRTVKEKTPLNNLRKAFSQSLDSFTRAFANLGKKEPKRSSTQTVVTEVKESNLISSLKIRSTKKLPTPVGDLPKGNQIFKYPGFRDSQEIEPAYLQEGPKIAKTKPTIKGFALQTQISLKTVVDKQETIIELESKAEPRADVKLDESFQIDESKILSEQDTSVNLTLLNSDGAESEKSKAVEPVDDDYDPAESDEEKRKRYKGKLMNGTAKITLEFTDKYILGDMLGDGAFGFVFTAITKETGVEVAVKFIMRSKIYGEGWVKEGDVILPAEVATLKKLRHPNIIRYIEHITDEHYILLVTELHGTPWDASNLELTPARNPGIKFKFKPYATKYRNNEIKPPIAKKLFAQIILACDYLHSNGLVHRDIKDENIVVDASYTIKMIDFGSASAIPTKKKDYFTRYNGTPHFASPEIVQGYSYRGPEAEIWALGVLLYTIVFGENPFHGNDDILAYNGRPTYPRRTTPELENLIDNMLHPDPKRRFSLQRVKDHPWLRDVLAESQVFEHIRPVIDQVMLGKNATVFAYGQTGSGKTHTMNGTSYLEIYNEKIYDLLSINTSNLDLRETSNKEIVVAGITRVALKTMEDFNLYHQKALKQRSTAETKLNESSSRSHFILQLNILQKRKDIELNSKLHLIDLAGSEDNKRTGNSGQRMNESCAINKSLFVLGQVVEGLNKNATRIPYRDSKITRFLQDSLGGSAIGVMIACCSPIEENYIDTFNTLNFAQKSSLIKNTVTINSTNKKEDSNSRLEALSEWKKTKASTKRLSSESQNAIPSAKRARLSAESNNSISFTGSVLGTQEFEDKVNMIVEQRIKSILEKNNLTKKLQKTKKVLEGKLKKESVNKENTLSNIDDMEATKKTSKSDASQIIKVDTKDNHDLDALKNSTTNSMLHILNHGNMKSIMTLKMIGKKRAEAILEAREKDGIFAELNDLERAGLKQSQISSIFKKMADLEFETVGVKKRQAYSYKKNPNTRELLLSLAQKFEVESKKTVPLKLWEEIASTIKQQLGNSHENVDKITATSVKTFYRNWKKKEEEEPKNDKSNCEERQQDKDSIQVNETVISERHDGGSIDTEKENKDTEVNQPAQSNEYQIVEKAAPKKRKSLGLPRTPIIANCPRNNPFDAVNVSECESSTPELRHVQVKHISAIASSPIFQDRIEDQSKYFQSKDIQEKSPVKLNVDKPEVSNAQTVISNLKETPNKSGKIICYVCARAVTKLSDSSRAKHFDKCINAGFTTVISNKYFKHPISTLLEPINQCPFCKIDWNNSSDMKLMHLKSCIKHQEIAAHTLLRYFKSLKLPEPEIKL
ncbi:Kinesin-like protein kif22 [Boothiomyces sp. JEL0838]|nr:Kinesin-like protein kif22 [Boothiomyces sp. JEL0838]